MEVKTKLIIIAVAIAAFVGLGTFCYFQKQKIDKLQESLIVASNNNKAFEAENSALNDKIIEFQLTAEQLEYSRDSLFEKLNSARKSLNIKDKQLRELQYLASVTHKSDTVFVKDTIFKTGVALDTLIGDEWSSLKLHAEYPNILNADYSFKNSTVIVAHDSRVTVDPPKKC